MIIKRIFYSFLILSGSLGYGQDKNIDVSEFDIKGVKLNSDYSSILKQLPCSVEKTDLKTGSGKTYIFSLGCEDKNSEYRVMFNRNKKILDMTRYLKSDSPFDYEAIKIKAIKKYGEPTAQVHASSKQNKRNYIKTLCWGDCKTTYKKNKHVEGTYLKKPSQKHFDIKFTEQNGEYELLFRYEDPAIMEENNSWVESEKTVVKKINVDL